MNMELKFSKFISLSEIKNLIKSFYELTGIMCFIKCKEKKINVFSNKDSLLNFRFRNYDKYIIEQIMHHNNKYATYKSKSGLMYVGIPVYIGDKLECIIFTTPIFYKDPDMKYLKDEITVFRKNESKILDLINDIPVFSYKKISKMIKLFCTITGIIQEISYSHIKCIDYNKKEIKQKYNYIRYIKKKAYYDELTSLPNWNYLKEKMKEYIELNPDKNFALIHIDLDNFKNINDIFGYKYGDNLLKKIGLIIKNMYVKDAIVARKCGNEFLVFKMESNLENLTKEVQNILDTLSGLWNFNGTEVLISVSIGISRYPNDACDAMGLIRRADIALNKAKSSERNSYKIFEKYMYDDILRKSEMEKELRKAIKNDEFVLYYQPQMDIKINRILSFEALIRWNNPRFGWIMPNDFIGLSEETGLIVPIGEWVFKQACIQSATWKEKGYSFDFISINVSTVQLKSNGFVDMVKRALEETGADPKSIEVEITESVVMESLEENLKIINKLKDMNIRVALDDFGSGYSSLNYLKSIPINTIKIDKTFIDGICRNSYENIIIEQIINLAHKMKLDVIAEGVEFKEQFISLKMKDCNKIQGYYFGKPMPIKSIDKILREKS